MVRDGLSEEEVVQPSPRWGEGVPALQAEGPPWAKAWSWDKKGQTVMVQPLWQTVQ